MKTRRNRLGRRRTYKKKGGNITREEFEAHERKLGPYFTYASVVKNYLIPSVLLMGAKCDADKTKIRLLYAGANGLALQFSCKNGVLFTTKLKYELKQTLDGVLPDDIKESYKASIKREYEAINRFDNRYIMKALKYFYFNPSMKKIFVKNKEARDQIIEIKDELGNNFKFKPEDANDTIVPFFGGLILESVHFRLVDAPPDVKVLKELFKQYATGLKEINSKGYIHNDIKPDNLMFNKSVPVRGNVIYFAKIIDLGEVYFGGGDGAFTPASQEYAPKEDIKRLQELTGRVASPDSSRIISAIIKRYDIYCLAKSFQALFGATIAKDRVFNEVITKCLKENYAERLSVDDGRIKLL